MKQKHKPAMPDLSTVAWNHATKPLMSHGARGGSHRQGTDGAGARPGGSGACKRCPASGTDFPHQRSRRSPSPRSRQGLGGAELVMDRRVQEDVSSWGGEANELRPGGG